MTARSGAGSTRDDARLAIAKATCTLVAEEGLDHVSLRRIASHLGSTTGYITHYYADKDALLEAALVTALDELTPRDVGWSANLEEWIDAAIGSLPHNGEPQQFWRVLIAFQAASLTSARLAGVLRGYIGDRLANLADHLSGHLDGPPPRPQLEDLARSIFVFVSGLGTTSITTPGTFSAGQLRAVVRAGTYGLIEEFEARVTQSEE